MMLRRRALPFRGLAGNGLAFLLFADLKVTKKSLQSREKRNAGAHSCFFRVKCALLRFHGKIRAGKEGDRK